MPDLRIGILKLQDASGHGYRINLEQVTYAEIANATDPKNVQVTVHFPNSTPIKLDGEMAQIFLSKFRQ